TVAFGSFSRLASYDSRSFRYNAITNSTQNFAGQLTIDSSPNTHGIPILQLRRQCSIRKVLEADRTGKAQNCLRADRCKTSIGGRWIGSAVNHRVADLHSGWISIKDQTPDLRFENFNKIGELAQILIRSMNRCRQMALEPFCKSKQLRAIVIANHQGGWSKKFFLKMRIGHHRI